MALGNILKEARIRKELSASEVAAITRMKIQLVQAIEKEDYSAFPAIIYGKGFIKLFSECVDIDPSPLIEEYVSAVSSGKVTQPAPAPIRKPRKILIDTEPPPDDTANNNKKTENKPITQPELPIQDKVPPQKTTTENKPKTDDLFSRINTENKQQETPLYHHEKTSEPIKEIKLDGKVKSAIKEPTTTVDKEEETDVAPNQVPLSTIPKPAKKETKTVPAPTPIKKQATDTSLSLKNLNLSETHIKTASISAGILILLILMTTTISRCSKSKKETPAPVDNTTLQLAIPPADPYLE